MAKYNAIGRNGELLGVMEAKDAGEALNDAVKKYGVDVHHVEQKAEPIQKETRGGK